MAGRRKGKTLRSRSGKVLRRRRLKSKKYKNSKWKLEYPQFIEIPNHPFIVRKDDKRYKNYLRRKR